MKSQTYSPRALARDEATSSRHDRIRRNAVEFRFNGAVLRARSVVSCSPACARPLSCTFAHTLIQDLCTKVRPLPRHAIAVLALA